MFLQCVSVGGRSKAQILRKLLSAVLQLSVFFEAMTFCIIKIEVHRYNSVTKPIH